MKSLPATRSKLPLDYSGRLRRIGLGFVATQCILGWCSAAYPQEPVASSPIFIVPQDPVSLPAPRERSSNAAINEPPRFSLRHEVLLRSARNAVALQDYPAAIEHFEELIQRSRVDDALLGEYVGVLVQHNELAKAQSQLEKWLASNPDQLNFLHQHVSVLVQQGKHAAAEKSLRRLVSLQPTDVDSATTLARVLAWQGKRDDAKRIYASHVRVSPSLAFASRLNIAHLLMELNDPASAISILDALFAEDPSNAKILMAIALAHSRLGNFPAMSQAISHLEATGQFTPALRTQFADTLWDEGRADLALQQYHQVVAEEPANARVHARMIQIYIRRHELSNASRQWNLVAEVANTVDLRLARVSYCTAIGEHATAHAMLQSLHLDEPKEPAISKSMGVLFLAMGDLPAAESYLQKALSNAPKDPELPSLVAEVLVRQSRLEEAIGFLSNKATKPEVEATIADMQLLGRAYQEAEATCLRLLASEQDPTTALRIRTTLGFAQWKQGKNAEARETLQSVHRMLNGNTPRVRYGLYKTLLAMDLEAEATGYLSSELQSFGPMTQERVTIAQLAMADCDCRLAERLLERARMFDPSNALVMVMLAEAKGMCNRCDGDCDDQPTWQTILHSSPNNTRAQVGLARSLSRTNDAEESRSWYRRILASMPCHETARIELARLTYSHWGPDQGNSQYLQAIARNRPDQFVTPASLESGDYGQLEMQYGQASYRSSLIESERSGKYYKDWKPQRSLGHFRSLVQKDATNQEGHFDLAQTLSSLGYTRQSIAQYDCLLGMDPCHKEAAIAKYRSGLELQPRWQNSFDFEYRAGRQGLTDISLMRIDTVAVKPFGDEDEFVSAGYAHRFLWPKRGASVDANVAFLGFQFKPIASLQCFTNLEVEQFDHGFSTRVPFRSGLRWRTPNDMILGFQGFLENVAANGESIAQDTYRGGFELSARTFATWRWEIDGFYRYAAYSDRNSAHEAMIRSNYLLVPGRIQLRYRFDASLLSFDEGTRFNPVPLDLTGVVHPYFSPSGFVAVTNGFEVRTWLSPHNFRGASAHWHSIYGGGRIDSDGVGYGLVEWRANHDIQSWLSLQAGASTILSSVYQSVGAGGMLVMRWH